MTAIQELPNRVSQSSSFTKGLPQEELKGEDLKGAFLSLLQGLVGFSGAVPIAGATPEAPMAAKAAEPREIEVKKDPKEMVAEKDISSSGKEGYSQKVAEVVSTKADVKEDGSRVNTEKVVAEAKEVENLPDSEVSVNMEKTPKPANAPTGKVSDLTSEGQKAGGQVVQQEVIESAIAKTEVAVNEGSKLIKKSTNSPVSTETKKVDVSVANTNNTDTLSTDSQTLSEQIEVESVSIKKQVTPVKSETSETSKEPSSIGDRYARQQLEGLLKENTNVASNGEVKAASQSKESKPAPTVTLGAQLSYAQLMLGVEATNQSSNAIRQVAASQSVEALSGFSNKTHTVKSEQSLSRSSELQQRVVQQQEFVSAVKEAIARAAASKDVNEISVKIDPPHLGEVLVRVRQDVDGVHAKITSENKDVEQVLRTKSSELSLVLQALGFKSEEVQVTIGSNFDPRGLMQKNLGQSDQGNRSALGKQGKDGGRKGQTDAGISGQSSVDGLGSKVNPKSNEEGAGWVA